jgi:hypothetical protein
VGDTVVATTGNGYPFATLTITQQHDVPCSEVLSVIDAAEASHGADTTPDFITTLKTYYDACIDEKPS